MKIISASINLSKVDESKIIKGKTGNEFINVDILVQDEKDRYGYDCSIILQQSKEEREAKQPRTYIGNGKTVWSSAPKHTPEEPHRPELPLESNFDDLPF
jgi:hypothetical protein